MAYKSAKFDQNVDGRYYVDDQCIACDACVMEAEDFFVMNDDDGHAYVKKQPSTPDEEEMCVSALEACPVEAIGNDA